MTAIAETRELDELIPPAQRWLIAITVMLVTVLEILDMTIVNVSLPAMMGSLSCNLDQITWVLTSYIVAAAICMPLTGFLVKIFGRRRLLIINILGFMASSVLCGMADNIAQMVFFRSLQGIFGASLVPLSQYILRETFPKEELGKAMAIWGIGIMTAPVLGPSLGGYVTEHYSWRWLFYINVPLCLIACLLTMTYLRESVREKVNIDYLGMGLMIIGVGCLQLFLDQGNRYDWFASDFITLLAFIWIGSLSYFVYRGLRINNNIINLRLLKNRNFSLCSAAIMVFCGSTMAAVTLQPMRLESVNHFPAVTAGMLMAPRGLSSAVAMMLVGAFMNKLDGRWVCGFGVLLSGLGTYLMAQAQWSTPPSEIMWVGALQGVGLGCFFVPLSTYALGSLSAHEAAEASGFYSFARSLGSSIGISIATTILTRDQQWYWQQYVSNITPFNLNLQAWLHQQGQALFSPSVMGSLIGQIQREATNIAFNHLFWLMAIATLCITPLIGFLRVNQSALDHIKE